MSWVPGTKRWAKWYRGKTYSRSCAQLNCPETKEASWRAANAWWVAFQAELDAKDPPKKKAHVHQAALNVLAERLDWAKAHAPGEVKQLREVEKETKTTPANLDPPEPDIWDVAARVHQFKERTGIDLSAVNVDTLTEFFGTGRVWQDRLTRQPVDGTGAETVRTAADEYLGLQRKKSPGTYGNIRKHVNEFVAFATDSLPVTSINEDLWTRFYLQLDAMRAKGKLSETTCKNRLVGVRPFIRHLYAVGKLEALPRNLTTKDLSFVASTKAIVLPKLEEVRAALKATGETQVACYLWLILNCGMQNVDVGELTPMQIDWDKGTLTKKRVKTKKAKNVPTVTYKLWEPTLRLLKEHNSERADFVLTTADGTCLFTKSIKGDVDDKKDMVQTHWWRWKQDNGFKTEVTLASLRGFCSTLLETSAEHAWCAQLYLGHAPTTVMDKYYKNYSQERFDLAIQWLGERILETAKADGG